MSPSTSHAPLPAGPSSTPTAPNPAPSILPGIIADLPYDARRSLVFPCRRPTSKVVRPYAEIARRDIFYDWRKVVMQKEVQLDPDTSKTLPEGNHEPWLQRAIEKALSGMMKDLVDTSISNDSEILKVQAKLTGHLPSEFEFGPPSAPLHQLGDEQLASLKCVQAFREIAASKGPNERRAQSEGSKRASSASLVTWGESIPDYIARVEKITPGRSATHAPLYGVSLVGELKWISFLCRPSRSSRAHAILTPAQQILEKHRREMQDVRSREVVCQTLYTLETAWETHRTRLGLAILTDSMCRFIRTAEDIVAVECSPEVYRNWLDRAKDVARDPDAPVAVSDFVRFNEFFSGDLAVRMFEHGQRDEVENIPQSHDLFVHFHLLAAYLAGTGEDLVHGPNRSLDKDFPHINYHATAKDAAGARIHHRSNEGKSGSVRRKIRSFVDKHAELLSSLRPRSTDADNTSDSQPECIRVDNASVSASLERRIERMQIADSDEMIELPDRANDDLDTSGMSDGSVEIGRASSAATGELPDLGCDPESPVSDRFAMPGKGNDESEHDFEPFMSDDGHLPPAVIVKLLDVCGLRVKVVTTERLTSLLADLSRQLCQHKDEDGGETDVDHEHLRTPLFSEIYPGAAGISQQKGVESGSGSSQK